MSQLLIPNSNPKDELFQISNYGTLHDLQVLETHCSSSFVCEEEEEDPLVTLLTWGVITLVNGGGDGAIPVSLLLSFNGIFLGVTAKSTFGKIFRYLLLESLFV